MSTLTLNRLTDAVGAEVVGIDADRLLHDDTLPGQFLAALEENGVLVFPRLGPDPAAQVALCERLGRVDLQTGQEPGIMRVSLDPSKSASAEYLRGTFNWHIDGCTLPPGRYPAAATVLTAVTVADHGGQTEFASTYGAYESLDAHEKDRYGRVRVLHTVAATQRRMVADPTPEQEAGWAGLPGREHPLVWRHVSGRRSLVIGATADHVVGMDVAAGRALLDELLERSTTPERVYRHEWSVGDTVIWDNRGVLHRVEPYDDASGREMIRTSLEGDEPIQ
jgi:alpha-ketoglutarate-dependent taurine dioxygenase